MRFVITFNCDNAAFGEGDDPTPEIKRILKRLVVGTDDNTGFAFSRSDKRFGANRGAVRDSNGNTVGHFELVDD